MNRGADRLMRCNASGLWCACMGERRRDVRCWARLDCEFWVFGFLGFKWVLGFFGFFGFLDTWV